MLNKPVKKIKKNKKLGKDNPVRRYFLKKKRKSQAIIGKKKNK